MRCMSRCLILLCLTFIVVVSQTKAQIIQTAAGNGGFGFSGDGGPATAASLNYSIGVAVDSKGNLYIADSSNERIRVVNTQAIGITVANVAIPPGDIATVAGNGLAGYSGDNGAAINAELNDPVGVVVDPKGNIFISDRSNGRVRRVDVGGIITTVTGNGTGSDSGDNGLAAAAYLDPYGIAVDAKGNLYIADVGYLRIRAVNLGTAALMVGNVLIQPGNIATVAGNGNLGFAGDNGPATSAEFDYPYGVAVDTNGNIYICDTYNREMRVVNVGTTAITIANVTIQPGSIRTVAGDSNYGFRGDGFSALTAEFADPDDIAVDSAGNIYVSDVENARIRMINGRTGIISTIAGTGAYSYNGDNIPATSAALQYPRMVAIDSVGNVYIADQYNLRIRKIALNPGPPAITSRNSAAFTVGVPGTFIVTTAVSPTPTISEPQTLPGGITFVDNHDGTGTLGGTPFAGTAGIYNITFTASNGVLPNAVQSFTLVVYAPGNSPVAVFSHQDTTTQGGWQGVYGADGYSVANATPQSIPSYASFQLQNQVNYTWLANTTDVRALQIPGTSSAIASAWYNSAAFSVDVNITDGNSHQLALYALDWDVHGRSEVIQIFDANSGLVLDTQSVSNFASGVYLVWNIRGHVQIAVTATNGPNAVISGIFLGGGGTLHSPILGITKTHAGPVKQGQQNLAYTVSVSNLAHAAATTGTVTVSEAPPSGLTVVSMQGTDWNCDATSCTRGDSLNGGSSYPPITVTVNVAINAGSPQVNLVRVSGGGSSGTVTTSDSATVAAGSNVATASFLGSDTVTQGNWQGTYGTDGYFLANFIGNNPTYGSFSIANQKNYTWAFDISDPRALTWDTMGDRIASSWYGANFSLDVSLDGNPHQVALYLLDWDKQGRVETIQVVDVNSGLILDTRAIPAANTSTVAANFGGGTYLMWTISGHVMIHFTGTGGPNAVVSGIFFGGPSQVGANITSASSATFTVGQSGAFAVTASGSPTPSLSESGMLPVGVSFVDNGNGTASLSGTPLAATNGTYNVTFTAANSIGSTLQKFTLTVNSQGTPVGNTAGFVTTDKTTQGNWPVAYGGDGYLLANATSQSSPSYASFSVQNQASHTWAAPTSDTRAPLLGGGASQRIAAAWYNSPTFNFDLNIADGNSHQFALYALDWDAGGRAETIQIRDVSTNALLDKQTISNFGGGVYLVWNITGHVSVTVTATSGANAVISGAFFGATSTAAANPVLSISKTHIGNFTQGQQGAVYSVVVANSGSAVTNGTVSVTETIPAGLSLVSMAGTGWTCAGGASSCTRSDALGMGSSYQPITVTVNVASTATSPQVNQVGASGGGSASVNASDATVITAVGLGGGPSANFVAKDSATQGNWSAKYGGDGYALANLTPQGIPGYGLFSLMNQSSYTWAASTGDARALLLPGSATQRIATTWFNGSAFTMNLNLAGQHQVALYAMDWDNVGRTETIKVADAGNLSNVLDTQTISNFSGGVYLVWSVSGNVTITVTASSGNAVVSGVFFGTSSFTPAPVLGITKAHTGNFIQGQINAPYIVTVFNSGNTATDGTVTVTDTLPRGLTLMSMTGMGWTCSSVPNTCTRNDALGAGLAYPPITVMVDVGVNATSPQVNQAAVSGGGAGPATAIDSTIISVVNSGGAIVQFVKQDGITAGNWQGVYGVQGYSLANVVSPVIPGYATLALQGQTNYTWLPSTNDGRAPLIPGSTSQRIAAAWYSYPSYSLDLNFIDGSSHSFALYALDWDRQGRSETVQVFDATSQALLDTQTISSFGSGVYLVWNIVGHVKILVTLISGPNAVTSAVFFN